MPPRKKRKLAESSGSEPDRGEDNDIFFLPPRSSPKTFPVDDSVSKYVSSCFYTYLKDDDFNKVTESDLKPDVDFFQAPIVNSTIKDKISDPGVLRGYSFVFKFQPQLISGANGILNLWQHIKDGKDLSHADVLKTLQRSLVLIGSSFAGLSSFRRYHFKSNLSPEFQSLVKEPEGGFSPSKFLFDDDLSFNTKNLSEENKLIRKITVPKKQPPQKFKPQYRARQQSAKNCNRFSNRRVVFKQITFRKQGHPHQFYRPITNPKSSKEFQAIKQEVNSLLSKGAIMQIPKSKTKFVSRLFTVPKTSGDLRPVINLKPLNQFLHLQTFKMEGLSDLKVLLEPNDFMITIDLSDAYMTFPIEEESRNYLCFQFQDQMFQFCVLPFGLNDALRAFTRTLKPPLGTLRSLGFKLVVYLDDIILSVSTRELCIYQGQILMKTLENLGFVINLEKSNLVPSQVVFFLGFVVDSKKMSRFKDSINQAKCPDSVKSTKGFITKTKPVHWNVQCFKNCSPRSTTSLQINPKSVDKHSKISAHHTTELRCENMSEQSVKKRFDSVGQKFENQLFKTNPPSTSGSFNYVRCLRSSLGSSPRICKNSGFLEKLSVFLAHKQK